MLRDITSSARVNTEIISCIRFPTKKTAQPERRQVKFTEEGISHLYLQLLTTAMATSKKRGKGQKTTPRAPKKPKDPPKPMIGSSSTWRQDELDLFEVRISSEADAKKLIPEKWFDFSSLEDYQAGKICLVGFDCSANPDNGN
jgi:hypothetical protein